MKIDPLHWPAISALFDEALDLPRDQHGGWLDALDEPLRSYRPLLGELLANHAHVETIDFLAALPKAVRIETAGPDPAGSNDRAVGPYRLVRELGRGGMGSVWLAERADGMLKRQVALKLPHPGLVTGAFAERLTRERDILAALSHPHIARLYDGGVTAEGQPYIALAYVQGHTVLEHCRALELGVRERVELFLQVLEAVQYAHAHLVIHSDIKPANVLVDDQGQVQLLDFGIAKLLVDGRAEASDLTLNAGQALTPDYASPEQIVGAGVSTASDVYSLGILLYELLAGERPYFLRRSAHATLEQAILHAEVAPPSTTARGAVNAQAASALRGDLDTIVLKALKKDPANRYATADAFKQDLQRYLTGRPVLARPDSLAYRTKKFLLRNRVSMGLVTLVVLALSAGLASTYWQAREARQAADRAQAARDFLIGLFNEADPAKARGKELTAREMVDRGQRDLLVKLADQPRLKADLDGVLVDLYTKLGDENKALPLAEARRDLALRLDGPESLAYGDALHALGRVHGGLNHNALAYDMLQQAASVLRRHAKERTGPLLQIEGEAAIQLAMLDRPEEAADRLRRVLPRFAAHYGPESWEVVLHQAMLAGTYSDLGQHAEAAALMTQIMPKLDHPDEAHALSAIELRTQLGYAAWNAKKTKEAEGLLGRAIADADGLLGPVNSLSVEAQRTLGLVFVSQGRFEESANTLRDSVGRAQKLGGEDFAPTRFAESFAVIALVMTGKIDEAKAMAERSVKDAAKVEGLTPSTIRGFTRRLGLGLLYGDVAKATQVLEDVLAQERRAGADKGGAHGTSLLYLAGAHARAGRHEAAAEAARQAALAFVQDAPWTNYAPRVHCKLTEALARARLHQATEAESLIGEARALLAKIEQPNQTDPLFVDLVEAERLRRAGQIAAAERIELPARERLRAIGGISLPRELALVM